MEGFLNKVSEEVPASFECPRLHERIEEIRDSGYSNIELEMGWFVVGGGDQGLPVEWKARELQDCVADLQSIARDVIRELDDRLKNCFSDLNRMLAECFDFTQLFAGVCRTQSEGRIPVDKKRFSEQAAKEFRKCVNYVSQMPHVKDENLELGSKLSSAVFWHFKKALKEVVWGDLFSSHFSRFLQEDCREGQRKFFVRSPGYFRWC